MGGESKMRPSSRRLAKAAWPFVLAIMLTGCGEGVFVQEAGSAGQAEAEEPPGPSLSLSVNGTVDPVIKAGTPLVFEVAVATADGRHAQTPISLSSASGGWGSLVKL